jgi:excinuclease ABC subunit C
VDEALLTRLDGLPITAGVYLFKDADGVVLYVGKAINLRARVRQYFGHHDGRAMIPSLLAEVRDVEAVLVHTEKEALILEATLIRRYRPRFNARLRDDKSFLHLRVELDAAWPRFLLVREIRPDGARYFGPFHSASLARRAMREIHRAFPLRSCTDAVLRGRRRPCILHAMRRCLAPCVGLCTPEAYRAMVEDAVLFMEGRSRELIARLQERMFAEAEHERFEEAARLRDLIRALESVVETQQVVDTRLVERDIWGLCRTGERLVGVVLPMREGRMLEPTTLVLEAAIEEDEAHLSSMLNRHYDAASGGALLIPPEILVPTSPRDLGALEDLLSERRGRKVRLERPERGPKLGLLEMAAENARHRACVADGSSKGVEEAEAVTALADLARVCRLKEVPRRIECFDNSNLGGTDPVAFMVVFVDGLPAPSEHRRYRIREVQGADDFATMREVLGRRFRRGAREGTLPDLVVLDGGRGQLSAARAALAELGFEGQPILGLAKPKTERKHGDRDAVDKIVMPDLRDPLRLRARQPALRLLQRMRDEAHRQALRYHRRVRSRNALQTVLLEIPGVGPRRARALLVGLGSARALLAASMEEIAAVDGIGEILARRIREALDAAPGT